MSDGRDEEETKEWDRFWNSGRVEDYLRYCGCTREEDGCGRFCGGEGGKLPESRDRFS